MKLFDTTKVPLLGKALDVYTLRQKVISSNIANITTIGYRAKSVTFEDQIAGSMQQGSVHQVITDQGHIAGPSADAALPGAQIVDAPTDNTLNGDSLASGLNNVDIDSEMANLAKNQIRFKFAARLLTDTFRDIQNSIRGSQS